MKRRIATITFCLIIVTAGIVVATVATFLRSGSGESHMVDAIPMNEAPLVKVQILKPTTVKDTLELTGSVEPWEDLTLSAEVGGKIEWLGAEEGDRVQKGEELSRVDTEATQAKLDEVKARYHLANQELERLENLTKRGVGSKQDLDKARSQQAVMEANLKATQIALKKSVIKAPIDGIVDKRFKDQGEFIEPGTPLIRLVQVDRVKVVVGIPERDVSYFSPGDKVTVKLDALADKTFDGVIHQIATTADESTRTFKTQVAVENPDGKLKPGMIARVDLVRHTYPNSLLVPMFSVISLENQRYAFVVEDGVAKMRAIETGVLQGSEVQVTKGLHAGDHLIVVGQRDARPGQRVKVTEVLNDDSK